MTQNIDKVFHTGYTYRMVVNTTNNPSTNKTTLTIEHLLICKSGYGLDISGRTNTCKVDTRNTKNEVVRSETKNFTSSAIYTGGNTTIKLGTTTHTVEHDDDGKASVTITGTFNIRATLSGTTYNSITASATIELPKINRKSTTLATDFDIGSAISIEVTRYNDAYTHTVVASIGEYSKTILEKSSELKKLTELDAHSLYAETPDSDEGIITLTTTTYNGDDVVGTTTSTVKCRVKNSDPVVNGVIISDVDAIVASDVIVRYLSNVRIKIDASAKNGATLTNYTVTSGAKSKSGASNVIDMGSVDENSFSVQVIDSRKNPSPLEAFESTNFIPYELPAISNIELVRTSEELNQAKAIIQGRWYADDINGTANKLRLSFRYKKSTEETWSDYIDISNSITENEFNIEALLTITGGFDVNSIYNIEIMASDNLTNGDLQGTLPKAVALTDHWEDDDGDHYNINAEIQQYGNPVALKKDIPEIPIIPSKINMSTVALVSSYSTTAVTVDFSEYIGIYIRFLPMSESSYVPAFIPKADIGTTAKNYQGADENNYVVVALNTSGNNLVIKGNGRSTSSGNYVVYGVKLELA